MIWQNFKVTTGFINPAMTTLTLTWSKLKTKHKKLHTATEVLPFRKYIHYNTSTRTITDYNHLTLGVHKSDTALIGVL